MAIGSGTINIDFEYDRQIRQMQKDLNRRLATQNIRFKSNINEAVTRPLGKATGGANQFNQALQAAESRILAFTGVGAVFFGIGRGIAEVVRQTIRVEEELTQINTILNSTERNLSNFAKDLFNIARDTGQSFQTTAEAANELARQGLGLNKTLGRTKDALILGRLSGLQMVDAVESVTAAINSFDKAALDSATVINRLANVDAAFAVSQEDLAKGIRRASAAANDAGVSFNQLLSLVSVAQQRTARGGRVIGNAFKTIFTRLQRTTTLDELENLGIAVRDFKGEALPAVQILQNMAHSFQNLTDAQEAAVAELVGGVFRINTLKAVLSDLTKRTSEYNRAMRVLEGTTNQANQRNQELEKTLSSLLQDATNNLTQLASKFGEFTVEPFLRNVIEPFNAAVEKLFLQNVESPAAKFGRTIGKSLLTGVQEVLTGPIAFTAIAGGLGALGKKVFSQAGSSFLTLLGVPQTTTATRRLDLAETIGQQPQRLSRFQSFLTGGLTGPERFQARRFQAGQFTREQAELKNILERQKNNPRFRLGAERSAILSTGIDQRALRRGVVRPTRGLNVNVRNAQGQLVNVRRANQFSEQITPISETTKQPGRFRRFLTTAAASPLMMAGGAFGAQFLGGQVAGLFDQQTRGGRIGAAISGGLGTGIGGALAGGAVGSAFNATGVGLAIGGIVTGLMSLKRIFNALTNDLPDLNRRLQRLDEIQTRLSETAVSFFRTQEKLQETDISEAARKRLEDSLNEVISQFPAAFNTERFLKLFEENGRDAAKEFLDSFRRGIQAQQVRTDIATEVEKTLGFFGQIKQFFVGRRNLDPLTGEPSTEPRRVGGNRLVELVTRQTRATPMGARDISGAGARPAVFRRLTKTGLENVVNKLSSLSSIVNQQLSDQEINKFEKNLKNVKETLDIDDLKDTLKETLSEQQLKGVLGAFRELEKLNVKDQEFLLQKSITALLKQVEIQNEATDASEALIAATDRLEIVTSNASNSIAQFRREIDIAAKRQELAVKERFNRQIEDVQNQIEIGRGARTPQETIRLENQLKQLQTRKQFAVQDVQTIKQLGSVLDVFESLQQRIEKNKTEFGGALPAAKQVKALETFSSEINSLIQEFIKEGDVDPSRVKDFEQRALNILSTIRFFEENIGGPIQGLARANQSLLDPLNLFTKNFTQDTTVLRGHLKDAAQKVRNQFKDVNNVLSINELEEEAELNRLQRERQQRIKRSLQGPPTKLQQARDIVRGQRTSLREKVSETVFGLQREATRIETQHLGQTGRLEAQRLERGAQLIDSTSVLIDSIKNIQDDIEAAGGPDAAKKASKVIRNTGQNFINILSESIREGDVTIPFDLTDRIKQRLNEVDFQQPKEKLLNQLQNLEDDLAQQISDFQRRMQLLGDQFPSIFKIQQGFISGRQGGRDVRRDISGRMGEQIRINQGQVNPLQVMSGGFLSGFQTNMTDVLLTIRDSATSVAQTMKSSFSDAFSSFVRGAESAESAFRGFALNVLNRISDIAANISTQLLFSAITKTTGIGGVLQNLNIQGFNSGGLVRGGSGQRDDVPAMLNQGEFVLRKEAVKQLGVPFLRMANAQGVDKKQQGGVSQTLANRFTFNDPKRPTGGRSITDSNLSNFALSNANNPQNQVRKQREKALFGYLQDFEQFKNRQKQALDAFENQQKQRIFGAGISGTIGIGAGAVVNALNNPAQASSGFAPGSGPLMDAPGSQVPGVGGGTRQTRLANKGGQVPTMLTGGEFVMNRGAVSKFGKQFFQRANRGQVSGMQEGGAVGSVETAGGIDSPVQSSSNDTLEKLLQTAENINKNLDPSRQNRQKTGQGDNFNPNFTIQINVNKDGSVDSQTQEADTQNRQGQNDEQDVDQMRQFGEQIRNIVQDEIIKQKRNRGFLSNVDKPARR